MKVLVDTSSLLWQSLLAGKDEEFGREVEHDGKKVWVNGWQHGLECSISHLDLVMRELGIGPSSIIFCVEGKYSKSRRKMIYPGYKESRSTRPPEAYVEFERCKAELTTAFLNVGSQVCLQDGAEGDDQLAYLAGKLDGEIVILTRDGDMTTLIDERVSLWQNGMLTKANKYGPFNCKYTPVYKALVGDSSDNIKGAVKFGEKAFLDFLVWGGDEGLAALEGCIKRQTLHELEDDVAEFKPMRKIIDSAESVYASYECALLHPEWVDTERQPLVVTFGEVKPELVTDSRLAKYVSEPVEPQTWWSQIHPTKPKVDKVHAVFDCELIGTLTPVFLVCVRVIETAEKASFWWHVEGDMAKLHTMLQRDDLTWVSFNGIHFDAPLISAAIEGKDPKVLKEMANALIIEGAKSWQLPSQYGYDPVEFDHIDLIEVSPGVRTSLKTFAGRMGYPTMVDMPFHHDKDLTADEMIILERYCQNDLGVTEALFNRLHSEIELRKEMSEEHGIDLRSKSDAQVAEAILKKAAEINGRAGKTPSFVEYKAPPFIETDSDVINELLEQMQAAQFKINPMNGQVEAPEFLAEPVQLGYGTYKFGVGGLHSTHDKALFVEATDEVLISDFDVASYYPNIMLVAGLTPRIDGNKGQRFIEEYRKIYERRIEAKHAGNKKVADALKISLNGTFGKLGSPYSAFYSPDLMLAVTLTGQLNLACLIYDIEFNPEVKVLSANTDGIMVQYPARLRDRVLRVIAANSARTGFVYEETPYSKIALKDVNNYVVITTEGKAKRKGLYASTSLMKNPTNQVCSSMAVDYLKTGIHPSKAVDNYSDITDFTAIRAIKGGGIQYDSAVEVDDWVCVNDLGTKDNEWRRPEWEEGRVVKRKSRPKPVEVGIGGEPFGRVARWYMSTKSNMPINYVGSGNKVPKTEGAKLCMTLPSTLPDDLDREWYVRESLEMLLDMGVQVVNVPELMKSIATDLVCN